MLIGHSSPESVNRVSAKRSLTRRPSPATFQEEKPVPVGFNAGHASAIVLSYLIF